MFIYLQFKSEFKENYLALTSLKIPLTGLQMFLRNYLGRVVSLLLIGQVMNVPRILVLEFF